VYIRLPQKPSTIFFLKFSGDDERRGIFSQSCCKINVEIFATADGWVGGAALFVAFPCVIVFSFQGKKPSQFLTLFNVCHLKVDRRGIENAEKLI
jgi:hypothetical protein